MNSLTNYVYVIGIFVLLLSILLYIYFFIFLSGSSPGKNAAQDKFINETCAPSGLLKTVLTWGYAKASFRRFYNHYRLLLFPQPIVSLGKAAADAKVVMLDGKIAFLKSDFISKMAQGMPLILNMGSYTWPPFACNVDGMVSLHSNYCTGENAVARMLTIYIEEAHAFDEWRLPESQVEAVDNVQIAVHKSIDERLLAAKTFAEKRKFPSEMLLVCDSMEGQVNDRYAAWPERLYIIVDGVVVYQGGFGPFDYKLWEVQDWLAVRYGMRGISLKRE